MKSFNWTSLEGVAFLASAVLAWRNARPTHSSTFLSFPQSATAQYPRSPQPRTPLSVANHPRQA